MDDDMPTGHSPSGSDPRLEIPEVLRQPVKKPDYDPLYGAKKAVPESASDMAQAGKAWAVALDFIVTILAGGLLGWLADRWRGSMPLWTMVGLGLGFATAFIRIVQRTMREERDAKARKGKGGGRG